MPMLNKSAAAARFAETMGTKAGRNAFIGNADAFDDPRVKNALNDAHRAMDDGLKLVDRLTKDESRTDASRHFRAKKEAATVGEALRKVQERMDTAANENDASAEAAIEQFLDIDAINPFILSKKWDFLKDSWADPNGGVQRINDAVTSDPHIAAILYRRDSAYLLGIPDAQRMSFVEKGVKVHAPDADASITASRKLRAASEKIPGTIAEVHTHFYNESMALKLSTRVED